MQVYTDAHVSTKYHWQRPHILSPESSATISWDIPDDTPAGACRKSCSGLARISLHIHA
jgi:DNA gyrase inhibitor GyrI